MLAITLLLFLMLNYFGYVNISVIGLVIITVVILIFSLLEIVVIYKLIDRHIRK